MMNFKKLIIQILKCSGNLKLCKSCKKNVFRAGDFFIVPTEVYILIVKSKIIHHLVVKVGAESSFGIARSYNIICIYVRICVCLMISKKSRNLIYHVVPRLTHGHCFISGRIIDYMTLLSSLGIQVLFRFRPIKIHGLWLN